MGRLHLGGDPLPRDVDVRCIACGDPLYFLPDSYPLVFHCGSGHFLTVQDLLDDSVPLGKGPRPAALEYWRGKSRLLQELAGHALSSGNALAAADLQETAERIVQWTRSLRKLLGPDSTSAAAAPPGEISSAGNAESGGSG
jgi:hypothetical protein